jgi:hypothetical protein
LQSQPVLAIPVKSATQVCAVTGTTSCNDPAEHAIVTLMLPLGQLAAPPVTLIEAGPAPPVGTNPTTEEIVIWQSPFVIDYLCKSFVYRSPGCENETEPSHMKERNFSDAIISRLSRVVALAPIW